MPYPKVDNEAPNTEDYINDSHRNSSSNGTFVNDNPNNIGGQRRVSKATLLRNPLAGMTRAELLADVDAFVDSKGLQEHREDFRKGALVAQVNNTPGAFEKIDIVTEEEKAVLRKEETSRWHQPFALYFLCTLCAGSAIVQGMDQTAVNGAQVCFHLGPHSFKY
jgi:hypothetical protein